MLLKLIGDSNVAFGLVKSNLLNLLYGYTKQLICRNQLFEFQAMKPYLNI